MAEQSSLHDVAFVHGIVANIVVERRYGCIVPAVLRCLYLCLYLYLQVYVYVAYVCACKYV